MIFENFLDLAPTFFPGIARYFKNLGIRSSGLAYKNGDEYSGWFYLTDLFVEKAYRGRGVGAELLCSLEEVIAKSGVTNIWVWTAGYEAPGFYQKMGYEIFAEMEDWYSDGSPRVGLRKKI